MEKIAGTIQDLLEKKLGLYNELRLVIEQEKTCIVGMDVDGVWEANDRKKKLVAAIEDIREAFKSHFPDIDGNHPFKLSGLLRRIPMGPAEKSHLRQVGYSIDLCKKEISLKANQNKQYITESLSVIDGIFSTIVNWTKKNQYGQSGGLRASQDQTRLIDAKV